MNKKKIGQFLRSLRKAKNLSQEKLSEWFASENFEVSVKAISDWENGKTIPEIEKLRVLSNFYGVSIDEILDGERLQNKDFLKEYVFANKDWHELFIGKDKLYEIHQAHKAKVVKRFKELLRKKISDEETKNEELEFQFLFEHFYTLSEYANQYVRRETEGNYPRLIEAIRNKRLEMGNVKKEVLFYEVSKFIFTTPETDIHLSEIMEDLAFSPYVYERFKMLEWWEKDMLLMTFQQGDVVYDPSRGGANYLRIYETNHGKEFDKNEVARNAIRYMIENGACLNYQFINIILKKRIKKRIIDRVEELYLVCEKPLECSFSEERKYFTSYVENTRKNRFLIKNYHLFRQLSIFQNLGTDELYDFVWKYNPENIPDDLLLLLAKKLSIDTNRDLKYVRADFKLFSYQLDEWKKYRHDEEKIDKDIEELKKLEEKLKNGEIYEFIEEEGYIGGKDFNEMMKFFDRWKTMASFDELKKKRDEKRTKQLLRNLDSYSLEDIRDIYMKEEVKESETCE